MPEPTVLTTVRGRPEFEALGDEPAPARLFAIHAACAPPGRLALFLELMAGWLAVAK